MKQLKKKTEELDWQDKSDEIKVDEKKRKREKEEHKPHPLHHKELGIEISTFPVHRHSF